LPAFRPRPCGSITFLPALPSHWHQPYRDRRMYMTVSEVALAHAIDRRTTTQETIHRLTSLTRILLCSMRWTAHPSGLAVGKAEKNSSLTSRLGLAVARFGSVLKTSPSQTCFFGSRKERVSSIHTRYGSRASWLMARPNNTLLHKILFSIYYRY
jgi:hypothetical protein